MNNEINYNLLEKITFEEVKIFLLRMSKISKENGNLFLNNFVLNYIEGILVNFYGGFLHNSEEELTNIQFKNFISSDFKKMQDCITNTLISYREFKKFHTNPGQELLNSITKH